MQAILSHSGYQVVAIRPQEDRSFRTAFQSLRHDVFVTHYHWEKPSHTGLETDQFDEHSTYVLVVSSNGIVMIGCRLIDAEAVRLPVTSGFQGKILPRSCEISRMAMRLEILDQEHKLFFQDLLYVGVHRYVFGVCRNHAVYTHIRARLLRQLHQVYGEGFFLPIGPACSYEKNGRRIELVPALGDAQSFAGGVAIMHARLAQGYVEAAQIEPAGTRALMDRMLVSA